MIKNKTAIIIASFLLLISVILVLIIIKLNGTKPIDINAGYQLRGQIYQVGYISISDNKSSAIIVARLGSIEKNNNNLFSNVEYSNSPPLRQKTIFFNGDYPLIYFSFKTNELFPSSKDFTIKKIQDLNTAENTLKRAQEFPVILTLELDSPNNSSGLNRDILKCNSVFIDALQKNDLSKINCTPLVQTIAHYDKN